MNRIQAGCDRITSEMLQRHKRQKKVGSSKLISSRVNAGRNCQVGVGHDNLGLSSERNLHFTFYIFLR